jgi:hypothetical protein
MGTIHGFCASSHASAICAEVAFFRVALGMGDAGKSSYPPCPCDAKIARLEACVVESKEIINLQMRRQAAGRFVF